MQHQFEHEKKDQKGKNYSKNIIDNENEQIRKLQQLVSNAIAEEEFITNSTFVKEMPSVNF